MGEPIFISFFPLSNKMHSYYLHVSKSLDQEMGQEPLFSLESNSAPAPGLLEVRSLGLVFL